LSNTQTTNYQKELAFALDVVKQVSPNIMHFFQSGCESVVKQDGTFVTEADKQTEEAIRQKITAAFPSDSIFGEEEGQSRTGKSDRKWIIDPIDGTYNFTRGIGIFSTLLALEDKGEIVLGVIHAPAVGDTFWASLGGGAYKNGNRLAVSQIDNLTQAQFNYGLPKRIHKHGYWPGYTELVKQTYFQRCYGDYVNFAYVFEGKSELALEVGLNPWDLAPLKIIAREAGGSFCDLDGGDSIYTGNCLVSNGRLQKAALDILTSTKE
jgi:histidinol-phosphatase